ncbi:hydroxycarboxylic acid receptor 3-like [Ambystoma mexicanum]|uniref:hydroxycarboxylic acid receptor 3-like n=1 Tax=Ambystoma mexicanum TaxID=8296 RepID=UPI0037E7F4C9
MSNKSCCFFEANPLSNLLPPLLILEFILGSVGNGVALWGFCFHIKTWKSSTVYLFNLAVADFLLIICLPFRTDYYLRKKQWIFGDLPCTLTLFMLAMNRAGSIFFLTLIALDRYFKVVHPHHLINSISNGAAACLTCLVWVLTIAITAYLLSESHLEVSNFTHCDSFTICPVSDAVWHDSLFLLEFFLPLIIILYCSLCITWRLRQRQLDKHGKVQRAVKLMAAVGVVFILCFLPSVATRVYILHVLSSPFKHSCEVFRSADSAFYITISLTYLNSMLDPLVYYFSNPSFQKLYLRLVAGKLTCQQAPEVDKNPSLDASVSHSISRL